jgi:hypothetical protein
MMAGASPSAPMSAIVDLFAAARWALYDAIGPTLGYKMSDTIVRVGKVYDGFLKALGFGVHNVPHYLNISQKQWWSQGNYCPN